MQALDHNASEFLRVVCWPAQQLPADALRNLAGRISRWDDVIRGATDHGILPILYSRLVDARDSIPAEVIERARREFERNAFHCMTNAEELLQVLNLFEAAAIHAMPFKGVVLGASAYGDLTLRKAGDIDLLIHYRNLQRATAILRQRGYELKTRTLDDGSPEAEDYFEFHFERPSDGMVLELRWRLELTQPRYRHILGLDWVWDRRRTLSLAGAQVPNLDPISSLLILCMHGSKHAWSRWMWVCDVAKLIDSEPALDWHLARQEARRVGLDRCLALGVLLASRGANATVPENVLRDFRRDRDMSALSEFFVANVLENPGAKPEGKIPYNLRILAHSERLRSILSLSILKPNDRDLAVVKLPKFLRPLYFVIRPLRILMDRSAR